VATSDQTSRHRGTAGDLSRTGRRVTDNRIVEFGARAGYAVTGVLHLLIAWLGLQVAFGQRGVRADQSGAMALVAGSPFGKVVLVAIVAAFLLLAVWQIGECVRGPEAGDRAKAAAKAVVYLALAGSPSRYIIVAGKVGYIARGVAFILIGAGFVTAGLTHQPSRSRGLDGALRDMVALPWGQAIVTLVALGFAAYGVYLFSRARHARV